MGKSFVFQFKPLLLGGYDVKPVQIKRFNIHLGERIDVIMCTDKEPGNYLIRAQYDYACALTKGHFIPPGFDAVPTCDFYAYLHYEGEHTFPSGTSGTGGGKHPQLTTGKDFDLTLPEGYHVTEPLVPEPEPAKADVQYTINLGCVSRPGSVWWCLRNGGGVVRGDAPLSL